MFCTNCGKELSYHKLCPQCGTPRIFQPFYYYCLLSYPLLLTIISIIISIILQFVVYPFATLSSSMLNFLYAFDWQTVMMQVVGFMIIPAKTFLFMMVLYDRNEVQKVTGKTIPFTVFSILGILCADVLYLVFYLYKRHKLMPQMRIKGFYISLLLAVFLFPSMHYAAFAERNNISMKKRCAFSWYLRADNPNPKCAKYSNYKIPDTVADWMRSYPECVVDGRIDSYDCITYFQQQADKQRLFELQSHVLDDSGMLQLDGSFTVSDYQATDALSKMFTELSKMDSKHPQQIREQWLTKYTTPIFQKHYKEIEKRYGDVIHADGTRTFSNDLFFNGQEMPYYRFLITRHSQNGIVVTVRAFRSPDGKSFNIFNCFSMRKIQDQWLITNLYNITEKDKNTQFYHCDYNNTPALSDMLKKWQKQPNKAN